MHAAIGKHNPEPLPAQVEHAQEASSERRKGGLLGGFTEVSTDDKDVAAAASFAAQQLSEQSNSLQPFAVKEVRGGAMPCHVIGLGMGMPFHAACWGACSIQLQ